MINSTGNLLIINLQMFASILSLCEKLTVLNFDDIFPIETYPAPILLLPANFTSSTLIKLKINVAGFSDCLRLLDGRLDSLSTLIINVSDYFIMPNRIDATVSIISIIMFREKDI
jgi:hypothetical protein